tara:strand:+ start:852 stop:3308 length:2457 start_codon:yes stop_codon:yes gene_type:complete
MGTCFSKKLLFVVVLFQFNQFFANTPISYRLGKLLYEKEYYDLSLVFLKKSREKLERKTLGEYYSLLSDIYLIKPAHKIRTRISNYNDSYRNLIRAKKCHFLKENTFQNKLNVLKDSNVRLMFQVLENGNKCTILERNLKKFGDKLAAFLVNSYKLHHTSSLSKLYLKNSKNYQISFAELNEYCKQNPSYLSQKNKREIENLLKYQLPVIFNSNSYDVLSKIIKYDYFKTNFQDFIVEASTKNLILLSDTLRTEVFPPIFHINKFYKKVLAIDKNLIPENHLKKWYLQHFYRGFENKMANAEKSFNEINSFNFKTDTVSFYINSKNGVYQRNFSIDDELWKDVLNFQLRLPLNEGDYDKVFQSIELSSTLIDYDSSLVYDVVYDFYDENIDFFLNNYKEYYINSVHNIGKPWIGYPSMSYKLDRPNSSLRIVNQILDNKMLSENALNPKDATKYLLVKNYYNPNLKNQEKHLKWFIPYFKDQIDAGNTKNLGEEMILATHIFFNNKEIKELRKNYLIKDYELSHQSSEIVWDSLELSDIENCQLGNLSESYYTKFLDRLKFFRRMVGINDKVCFKDEYNKQAVAAALIMNSNDVLTHHPNSTMSCYSDEGQKGASTGNLYLGAWSSNCIDGYIEDGGKNNTSVGHRRWIFNPFNTHFGTGSSIAKKQVSSGGLDWDYNTGSNCLVVITKEDDKSSLSYFQNHPVTWPTQGYFPTEFIKYSTNLDGSIKPVRFSFSLVNADFRNTKVILKQNGKLLKNKITSINERYGSSGIVWELQSSINDKDPISVKLVNIKKYDGSIENYEYEIIPFTLKQELANN